MYGTRIRPWVTWILCLSILAIGLLLILGNLESAVRGWGFIPAEMFRHAGLTWITAFFIHGGLGMRQSELSLRDATLHFPSGLQLDQTNM